MTDKYYPQGELKKLEIELWNLKVKGNNVPTYTNRFEELTLMCTKLVANESEKIDKIFAQVHKVPTSSQWLCTQKCHECNKVGHFARDCRSSGNTNVVNDQRDGKETPKGNGCFECEASGHFKRDCPKLKNKNGGNRNAHGWVYAV
nr:hypothetical protein [Tanacetum cinerariifolium]